MILSSILILTYSLRAEDVSDVQPLINAANRFLDSLDSEQLKITQFDFEDANREDWHYVPKQRKGLAWRSMQPEQKALSQAIFQTTLSDAGKSKAEGVVALEKMLWERSNRGDFRDPEKYYVTIFGKPAADTSWGASLEGHHLSINITVVEGREVFVTPSFFGANPDEVRDGDQAGLRPLKGEAETARQLLEILDVDQRKIATTRDKAPREILTEAEREISPLPTEGLPASEMNTAQLAQLRQVISEYVDRYRAPYAKDDWAKIEATGIEKIHFIWAGSDQAGEPMYYRLEGPSFVMEYVNVQNGGNHSHTVWRDFDNDFGRNYLKEHLKAAH